MKGTAERIGLMLTESIFEDSKMLFTFLEPSEEPAPVFDLETAIHYDGEPYGRNPFASLQELAASMASNLLGLGMDRVTESCAEDCAKEAVNMICGTSSTSSTGEGFRFCRCPPW